MIRRLATHSPSLSRLAVTLIKGEFFARIFLAPVILLLLVGVACGQVRVIEFTADWCKPCQEMKPIIERLRSEGYDIPVVNVDQTPSLAKRYGVSVVPTFVSVTPDGVREKVEGKLSYDKLRAMFGQTVGARRPASGSHYKAVARVIDGGNVGSGVLISKAGRLVLLTNAHVADSGRSFVAVADGKSYRCRVITKSPREAYDFAICATANAYPDAVYAEFRPDYSMVQRGEMLEGAGYGGTDSVLRSTRGRMTQWLSPSGDSMADIIEFQGRTRQGDSGGPIFDTNGYVVGVLFGGDGRIAAGTQYRRIAKMLAQCDPRQFAVIPKSVGLQSACDPANRIVIPDPPDWTPPILPEPDGPEPGTCDPAPQPPAPEPAPTVDLNLVAVIQQKVESNTKQIVNIQQNITTLIDSQAQVDKSLLDKIEELENRIDALPTPSPLAPLTVEFGDGAGGVAFEEKVQVSGGVLRIPGQQLRTYRLNGDEYGVSTAPLGHPVGINAELFLPNEGKQMPDNIATLPVEGEGDDMADTLMETIAEQNGGRLLSAGASAHEHFVTFGKVLDLSYEADRKMVSLVESLGVREVTSASGQAGIPAAGKTT